MTEERTLNEYSAVCYVSRIHRSEVFAFDAPAEVVEAGESIYVGHEIEKPQDGRLVKVRKIETDGRWHVRRFKIGRGWWNWTPWTLDEATVLIDAEDNPFYTRGSRRHYLERNWYAELGVR